MFGKKFISVIIPTFRRPKYLNNLLESIHYHADFPFEVLVHDDEGWDLSSLNCKDKISTLILNFGKNMGLCTAINRLVSCANSEYILFINDDCEMLRPCFNNIKNILDRPYVGVITFLSENYPQNYEYCLEHNGTRFVLKPGTELGSVLAFRKNFFQEVGGFEDITTPFCELQLMHKCWYYGYFKVTPYDERYFRNISLEDKMKVDTTLYGDDCCSPRIFKGDDLSHERRRLCEEEFNKLAREPEGWMNVRYWDKYSRKIIKCNTPFMVNWNEAGYGSYRWKDMIEQDKRRLT